MQLQLLPSAITTLAVPVPSLLGTVTGGLLFGLCGCYLLNVLPRLFITVCTAAHRLRIGLVS